MVWSPPQPPLASLPAARVSRRGSWGYFSGASRGIWREICHAGSENHLRAQRIRVADDERERIGQRARGLVD